MLALSKVVQIASIVGLTLILSKAASADDPPAEIPPAPAARFEAKVKPLPPVDIPDDPPPHEGAMIRLPYILEPPDIIVVEVLEALPGRPITGERMVRPDGKISLGFYGDVDVTGLTVEQAKVKVAWHLRNYLADHVLGFAQSPEGLLENPFPDANEEIIPVPVPNPPRSPFELDLTPPAAEPPPQVPQPQPSAPSRSAPQASRPSSSLLSYRAQGKSPGPFSGRRKDPRAFLNAPQPKVRDQVPSLPAVEAPEVQAVPADDPSGIPPLVSQRVFVDVSAYNTKIYFVLGDVGVPGRLPITGHETVLDAIQFAGGLVSSADRGNIHLHRPPRGTKPAKDYKIDLEAIHRGESRANLQLFPGDRLVVGRDPVVKATNDLDRLAAPMTTILNLMFVYGSATRTLMATNPLDYSVRLRLGGRTYTIQPDEPAVGAQTRRDSMMKEFIEVWSAIAQKNGGRPIDERTLRDAMIRRPSPPPAPEPETEKK